jgi:hypothetical protein
MIRIIFSLTFLFYSIIDFGLKAAPGNIFNSFVTGTKDSIERQILYNGRIWNNQFYNTAGHQFLLSSDFIPGSVKIDEYSFNNVPVRYDIFNDELLIQRNDGTIIQLNREMIDSFLLCFNNEVLHFKNFDNHPAGNLTGYCNVLYDGNIKIYVKYIKEILPTTITNGLPKFNQINKIYIIKEGHVFKTNSRKDLLNLLDKKEVPVIKRYIRSNHIRISRNDPGSYMRVIEYYETMTK